MTVRSTYSAHKRLVLGAVVLVLAATGLTGLATSALFTDTAAVTAGAFTTGTVSLTSAYPSTTLSLANMAPGDTVTAPITVTNNGSLPMRYSMTSVTSGDAALAAALGMTIRTGIAAASCNTAGYVGGTLIVGGTPLGSTFGNPIFGTFAAGGGFGEQTVSNGASQDLCVQIVLSPTWTTQSVSASATFTFNAEQIANN